MFFSIIQWFWQKIKNSFQSIRKTSPGKRAHYYMSIMKEAHSKIRNYSERDESFKKSKGTYECCAAYHYEHKWWNRELTLKCKFKRCYEMPMKDPLGVSPSTGNQGTTRGKEKIILTSVGIEPMTSGLDLPLLCRLSYEVVPDFLCPTS